MKEAYNRYTRSPFINSYSKIFSRPVSAPPVNFKNSTLFDIQYNTYYRRNSKLDPRLPVPNYIPGVEYFDDKFSNALCSCLCQCNGGLNEIKSLKHMKYENNEKTSKNSDDNHNKEGILDSKYCSTDFDFDLDDILENDYIVEDYNYIDNKREKIKRAQVNNSDSEEICEANFIMHLRKCKLNGNVKQASNTKTNQIVIADQLGPSNIDKSSKNIDDDLNLLNSKDESFKYLKNNLISFSCDNASQKEEFEHIPDHGSGTENVNSIYAMNENDGKMDVSMEYSKNRIFSKHEKTINEKNIDASYAEKRNETISSTDTISVEKSIDDNIKNNHSDKIANKNSNVNNGKDKLNIIQNDDVFELKVNLENRNLYKKFSNSNIKFARNCNRCNCKHKNISIDGYSDNIINFGLNSSSNDAQNFYPSKYYENISSIDQFNYQSHQYNTYSNTVEGVDYTDQEELFENSSNIYADEVLYKYTEKLNFNLESDRTPKNLLEAIDSDFPSSNSIKYENSNDEKKCDTPVGDSSFFKKISVNNYGPSNCYKNEGNLGCMNSSQESISYYKGNRDYESDSNISPIANKAPINNKDLLNRFGINQFDIKRVNESTNINSNVHIDCDSNNESVSMELGMNNISLNDTKDLIESFENVDFIPENGNKTKDKKIENNSNVDGNKNNNNIHDSKFNTSNSTINCDNSMSNSSIDECNSSSLINNSFYSANHDKSKSNDAINNSFNSDNQRETRSVPPRNIAHNFKEVRDFDKEILQPSSKSNFDNDIAYINNLQNSNIHKIDSYKCNTNLHAPNNYDKHRNNTNLSNIGSNDSNFKYNEVNYTNININNHNTFLEGTLENYHDENTTNMHSSSINTKQISNPAYSYRENLKEHHSSSFSEMSKEERKIYTNNFYNTTSNDTHDENVIISDLRGVYSPYKHLNYRTYHYKKGSKNSNDIYYPRENNSVIYSDAVFNSSKFNNPRKSIVEISEDVDLLDLSKQEININSTPCNDIKAILKDINSRTHLNTSSQLKNKEIHLKPLKEDNKVHKNRMLDGNIDYFDYGRGSSLSYTSSETQRNFLSNTSIHSHLDSPFMHDKNIITDSNTHTINYSSSKNNTMLNDFKNKYNDGVMVKHHIDKNSNSSINLLGHYQSNKNYNNNSFITNKSIISINNIHSNNESYSKQNDDYLYPNNTNSEFFTDNASILYKNDPLNGISNNTKLFGDFAVSKIPALIKFKESNLSAKPNIPLLMSMDQEGSRLIQKKMSTYAITDIIWFYNSIKYDLKKLCMDLFGNYVVQKLISHCLSECYFILSDFAGLTDNLLLNILDCASKSDNNKPINFTSKICDNNMLQNTSNLNFSVSNININELNIEIMFTLMASDIVRRLKNSVFDLCKHNYGCRVVQKGLETVYGAYIFLDIIKDNLEELLEDQNSNHVIQKAVELNVIPLDNLNNTNIQTGINEYSILSGIFDTIQKDNAYLNKLSNNNNNLDKDNVNNGIYELENRINRLSVDGNVSKTVNNSVLSVSFKKAYNTKRNEFITKVNKKIIAFRNKVFDLFTSNGMKFIKHRYGCRVIQRMIENSSHEEIKNILEKCVIPFVDTLIEDQYGNYVLQHLITYIPDKAKTAPISCNDSSNSDINKTTKHFKIYQDIHKKSTPNIKLTETVTINLHDNKIIDKLKRSSSPVQEAVETNNIPWFSTLLINKITTISPSKLLSYSTHKFASNVIEKIVQANKDSFVNLLTSDYNGKPLILLLACDKFGNYVVQRFIERKNKKIVQLLKIHATELKKSPYAKHIINKITNKM
ncbi:hypothetical protein EDEG_03682 [Edhazardia aedis USNM 41457]|uniref:PUM-HD domain-containing protein n=1 Tax=Edhazardia aedis (strain USNM 41457) TaxID=1003232 RepID=J9D1V1_EDHAE|nr:hypothetical protein EDEG_03682 [Edhazardia aedis USNM 41457]|eukprot:EJW01836.1 hypothetical protein EDEG_03682 [Edhazardia aedis USNM 41457]